MTDEDLTAAAFSHLDLSCWCGACDEKAASKLPEGDIRRIMRRMNLCPDCGNKRCPKSWNHRYVCGGSNEPGQVPVLAENSPSSPVCNGGITCHMLGHYEERCPGCGSALGPAACAFTYSTWHCMGCGAVLDSRVVTPDVVHRGPIENEQEKPS